VTPRPTRTGPTRASSSAIVEVRRADAFGHDGLPADSEWAKADSITDFRQRDPAEGAPASERTVVRSLRDDHTLFVHVRLDDKGMRSIRATQLRRDADLESDDYVTLIIDSFNDQRSAFTFRTNANGAMWDGQLVGLEDVNVDWNGIWNVAVTRDSAGWTAVFAIPFRTLRFRRGSSPTFGFNVQRFIRRKNEEDLWRSWGRAQGPLQLQNEGELTGFGGLSRRRDVDVRPYVLGQVNTSQYDIDGSKLADAGLDGKIGIDAKVAATATLTADLTINTDFAQVEVDKQVINLTRFPTFFPEKREFFLESSGIFGFGTAERAQLFYSRRIGLTDSGDVVPILGGARMYGKVGGWTLGALDARTGGIDQANDAVVRVKHDLLERSYIGAIGMLRSGPGVEGNEWAGGVDASFPLVLDGQNLTPGFWFAGTNTPAYPGTQTAWRISTDYPNDKFDHFISLYRIDPGFNPTLGFVRRTGIWETSGHFNWLPRPGVLGIRQLDIEFPAWDIIADEHGSLFNVSDWQTASFNWRPLGGTFQSGDHVEFNIERFLDAPTDTFTVFPGSIIQPGRYWWTRGEVQFESTPGRPLSAAVIASWGGFYDGTNRDLELSTTWRASGHLILGGDIVHSDVSITAGHFTAVETSARFEYAINTRISLLGFAQFINDEQRADFNLRFHWIPVIGDDLYVVWNSGYTTDPGAQYRFPHEGSWSHPLSGAFVVKYVHRFAP